MCESHQTPLKTAYFAPKRSCQMLEFGLNLRIVVLPIHKLGKHLQSLIRRLENKLRPQGSVVIGSMVLLYTSRINSRISGKPRNAGKHAKHLSTIFSTNLRNQYFSHKSWEKLHGIIDSLTGYHLVPHSMRAVLLDMDPSEYRCHLVYLYSPAIALSTPDCGYPYSLPFNYRGICPR